MVIARSVLPHLRGQLVGSGHRLADDLGDNVSDGLAAQGSPHAKPACDVAGHVPSDSLLPW
jgi:hypothetical protein